MPWARTIFKLCMAAVAAASACVIVLVVGEIYSVRSLRDYRGKCFELRGDRYAVVNPAMIPGGFSRRKPPDEFRVFVLGSSQRMGTPYVHQIYDRISTLFNLLVAPNEGGIPTWLRAFLASALEGRSQKVVVVNAAMGGLDLANAVNTAREILEVGDPDLLVLLEGNNERSGPLFSGYDLKDRRSFPQAMRDLTENYAARMRELVRLAEKGGVETYVLTVPTNIRDWEPYDIEDFDKPRALDLARAGRCDEIPRLKTSSGTENSMQVFLAAKCWDDRKDPDRARELYVRAKDLDKVFKRARSPWNRIVRGLRGRRIRVLDMERIVADYAQDGLPGKDLFLDECHFRLEGNRMVGFEIAKAVALDRGIPPSIVDGLRDLDVKIWTPRQLTALYILKLVKWHRMKLFSLARKARNDENLRNVIKNYEQAEEDHQAVDWVMRLQLKSAYRKLRGQDRIVKRRGRTPA
ncbi:MAG: hypothetical protein HZB91_03255 [Elusimicrobia bacterium]|nr:hypothetical protein [Elusimicrobiota bacterium]